MKKEKRKKDAQGDFSVVPRIHDQNAQHHEKRGTIPLASVREKESPMHWKRKECQWRKKKKKKNRKSPTAHMTSALRATH